MSDFVRGYRRVVELPVVGRETGGRGICHLAPGIWEMTAGGNAIVQLTALPAVPFGAVQSALQQRAGILGGVGCPDS